MNKAFESRQKSRKKSRQTLEDLASQLAAVERTSTDLVMVAVNEFERGDPCVFTQFYRDEAIALAQTIDAKRQLGNEQRKFAGIPITVKDLFDISGQETWAGSRVLAGSAQAQTTAPAIRKLEDAGFIVIGKTNMTEFAYSGLGLNPHFGTPSNPADKSVRRIPGGSSAGCAVSVAGGIVSAGIGSDTGGSVRIPASLCGLTGFKPSSESVSRDGVIPLSTTLDCIGPMAHSVQCCSDLYRLMAQPAGDNRRASNSGEYADPATIKLLVPANAVWEDAEIETKNAVEAALARLEALGAAVEYRSIPLLDDILASGVQGAVAGYESFLWHRPIMENGSDLYDPRIISRIQQGSKVPKLRYQRALQKIGHFQREFDRLMVGYDAIVYPTTAIRAPAIDTFEIDEEYSRLNFLMLRNTAIGNVLDAAAISLPVAGMALDEHASAQPQLAGSQQAGPQQAEPQLAESSAAGSELPIGLMLMRPKGHECQVLGLAAWVEAQL